METKYQTPSSVPNTLPSNSTGSSQNPQDPASQNMQSQVGASDGNSTVDWQEEVYQKIKSMKELYLPELSDLHQKVLRKLQQYDAIPQAPESEQMERLKMFSSMMDRTMAFLNLSKDKIPLSYKDKLPSYEKQIIAILDSSKLKKLLPSQQQQQIQQPGVHPLSVHQQQQQLQSQIPQVQQHENQMNSQMQSLVGQNVVSSMDSPQAGSM